MSGCRVVGVGCYGKVETFNRMLAKLLPEGAGLAEGVLKTENKKHSSCRLASLFSKAPFSTVLPPEPKPDKLNIAGFRMRKGENLTICWGSKRTAVQKIILSGKVSGKTECFR